MTSQIIVDRYPSEKDWTLSEFSILGTKRGVGVEDEGRELKVHGETCIPNGIYEIEFITSPTFSRHFFMDENGYLSNTKTTRFNKDHLLIHVKNVPGFDKILWHWGNTDDDTKGCYIVGTDFATFDKQKGVSASRIKYTEIYPIIYQMYIKNNKEGVKTLVEYKNKAA